MFSSLLGTALLSLALGAAASSHGPAHHRRHEEIAAAQVNTTETQLHRRGQTFTGARLTYYAVGLGACGDYNSPGDFIVALNSGSYGGGYPGPNCNRPIEITYNGKTANAVIKDECPGCPSPGGLDLSEGLFSYLSPLDAGVIYASWRYTDEGDEPAPAPTTSKWVAPTTTSEWVAPTTSKKPHTTKKTSTSTWTPEPTTTWSSSSSTEYSTSSETPSTTWTPTTSSTPSSSATPSSSSASSSASVAPAALATPSGPDTLAKLNQAVLGLTEIMIAAAEAN